MPEDQDAGAAPEGIRRDFFFRESPPGRGLPDRGGDTRRRPQRAGPCGKAAAQGDPPRSRPRSGYPPSFLRLPRVLGFTLCASPPRLGRPVAWREVSRKARIDVLTVAVTA